MEMDRRDSDLEGSMTSEPMSDNDIGEEDSNDALGRHQHHQIGSNAADKTDEAAAIIAKLKQEDTKVSVTSSVTGGGGLVGGAGFSLPLPFPFPPPGAASFLPPYPPPQPPPPPHHSASSVSPLSSESSTSSQHQTWSFEEQFKQVRQLYEISDDPKRKEFLDDLFNFMQRRGTPINRLPIMAKSVLDLYELYNLVIQRGGLVDVINKKLWQEIIKGLHLPSSITSAAFTLRTQYMKYLYPYECEKRRLSTPGELQAAIDGNRREGRRGSYGTYAEMMQRSPGAGVGGGLSAPGVGQMTPLSLVTAAGHTTRPTVLNGSANNHHHPHHNNNNHLTPHHSLLPPNLPGAGGPAEFEARMAEYVKLLNKELANAPANPQIKRQTSPPGSPPEPLVGGGIGAAGISPLEMTKLSLWSFYGASGSPEPQKEALNLEKRDEPPPKRPHHDADELHVAGTNIKISTRGDGRGGTTDNSLVVSIDINGIMYQGVLFAQTPRNPRLQT